MSDERRQDPAAGDDKDRRKEAYVYKDAGLTEHHGFIPRWLLAVVVVLVIWGIYYLVAYWKAPSGL